MTRYIDADKIEYEDMLYPRGDGNYEECQIAYRDQIDDIPTANVVEVVRCKDCKYWQDNNGGYPNQNCRWMKDETPDDDDYCSYGERAEE